MDRTRQKAANLYLGGMSMNAVGAVIGATGPTIKRWIEAEGINIRYSRPTYSVELKQKAERLYVEDGLSSANVAAILGLKPFTVKGWMQERGVMRSMSEAASLSTAIRPRARSSSRLWFEGRKTKFQVYCESSLEYLRMQQLESDPTVKEWSRCLLRVPYISPDGKTRHYVPDLWVKLVCGKIFIEEVKPRALICDPVNQAKFAACRAACARDGWTFRILTEHDVGYARATAPSVTSREDRNRRSNILRRHRRSQETRSQRNARLAKSAEYACRFRNRQRELKSGTNINTTVLTIFKN